MPSHHVAFRLCVATALTFAALTPAEAQRTLACQDSPCFVRIIWDVGSETFHVRTYEFTSEQSWSFPPRAGNGFQGFSPFSRNNQHVIRRGDHVRLHVTNYNPVSHKPLKGQVLTLPPEVPFTLGVIAALARLGSGGVAPPPALRAEEEEEEAKALVRLRSRCERASFDVNQCLNAASVELTKTSQPLEGLRSQLARFKALDDAMKGFGDSQTFWSVYDNAAAERELDATLKRLVPDGDYNGFAETVEAYLTALTQSIAGVSKALSAVDVLCAAQKPGDSQYDACRNAGPRRDRVHDAVTALAQQLVDTEEHRSEIAVGVARYKSSKSLVRSFVRKLDLKNEADFVADVDVTTSAPENGTLVLDMPFGSQEKDSTRQTTKSVVLRTDHAYPALFATVGVLAVAQPFDFQDAALVDVLNDQKNGVNKRWAVKPSDKFLPLGAALLTHVHVGGTWARAFYLSFGTTADKNVFSNILLGGSAYIPQWRAVLTGGVLGARGSIEKDLLSEFAKLQDDKGNAFGSAAELPDTRKWHWKPAVSLSFKPF